jgi:large subunit ribosomal protein L5
MKTATPTIFDLNKNSFKGMKDKGTSIQLKNPMQAPRLVKVVVSTGIGSIKDKKKIELIADRMAKITGQKPSIRGAKKSIASFKTRTGDPSGYVVTLRGKRMTDFVDRLVHIALPRTKDFRGISRNGIDEMGNYTLGVKEHTIFPETSDEDLKDVFGLGIVVVTTSKKKDETLAFLEYLGFPFKKADEKKK